MSIKITDGFVWAVIDNPRAEEDLTGIAFILYDDDSEGLIETYSDWLDAVENYTIGIELGHEAELKADWQEARARNKDPRNFRAWLEDKAESLIY